MNNLEEVLDELIETEDDVWVKYLKKGKTFARHGVVSSYDENKFTLLVKSVRRNGNEIISKLPIQFEELLFIGNEITGERLYINDQFIDIKE